MEHHLSERERHRYNYFIAHGNSSLSDVREGEYIIILWLRVYKNTLINAGDSGTNLQNGPQQNPLGPWRDFLELVLLDFAPSPQRHSS